MSTSAKIMAPKTSTALTVKGIDTNHSLISQAGALKAAGYSFAARYLKPGNPEESLSHAEALHLSESGIEIVSIWEEGYPTSAAYFGQAKGLFDGARAFTFASAILKQPGGTVIYATVDYDASPADIAGPVTAYFEAFKRILAARAAGKPELQYNLGVYGSGAVCKAMLDAGLATHAWLTMSKGWRGSRGFAKWAINQTGSTTIGGISCDTDVARGDFGAWTICA